MQLENVIRTVDVNLDRWLHRFPQTEEIRVGRGRYAVLNAAGENILTDIFVGNDRFNRIFAAFCGHSLYAYEQSLCRGYLELGDGFRVGVCGRAMLNESGAIRSVRDISDMSIRIPHEGIIGTDLLYTALTEDGAVHSCLLFSSPGVGKTTALRSLAYRFCGGEKGDRGLRVAVIDSRCELYTARLAKCPLLNFYLGYPKADGIELATRTMAPQLILCDEIGGMREAEAILSVQNTGVPLIATAHAGSLAGLLRRKNIAVLHDSGVFERYGALHRVGYTLTAKLTRREDVTEGGGDG